MPVKLISKDEQLEMKYEDSIFYYRRMSNDESSALRRKHTQRGQTDFNAVGIDSVQSHVVGWKNVTDIDGNEVPFSKENLLLLPDDVLVALINAISSADANKREDVEKN